MAVPCMRARRSQTGGRLTDGEGILPTHVGGVVSVVVPVVGGRRGGDGVRERRDGVRARGRARADTVATATAVVVAMVRHG